jgi:3-hydroxyisobutyrate dehydrogenase-like beta-hydroxyacid dehydrogenase
MVSLATKDLRLAHELAAQVGVPLPVTAAAKERFDRAMREGLGELAAAAVAKLQEQDAGVEVDGRK